MNHNDYVKYIWIDKLDEVSIHSKESLVKGLRWDLLDFGGAGISMIGRLELVHDYVKKDIMRF